MHARHGSRGEAREEQHDQSEGPRPELLAVAEEYWESVLQASPSLATLLGDRRFDNRIEDLSRDAEEQLQATWELLLSKVDALDPTALGPSDRVTRSLLRTELWRGIEALSLRLTEMASDQMEGVHAGLLTMAPQQNAPEPDNARDLTERHRQIGTLLEQATERFRAGVAAGRHPARLTIERSLNQLDGYLASDLHEDPFVTLAGPQSWDGETAWREDLAEIARDVIRPALQRYRQMLADELLPVARPDDRCGLCWLGSDGEASALEDSDGDTLYRSLIRRHTTLDEADADEIHTLGLAELDRLRDEYAAVGTRLFGTADLAEIFRRLREDPELRYATGDEITDDARECLAAASAAMGDWFGRLPQADCDIKPVPDFLAADAPAAYYFPPAADGSRPGAYFVNRSDPAGRSRYETASVAFHEAIPGHHLQLSIANELEHLPRFQRHSFSNTAFVEGWALYTERLADEMALYRNDLDRIGMLAGDSWRSCRLVVDTGLHAKGWSRQQAVDFMVANAPVGVEEIKVEVDRYVAMPGQALAYKVGQLEIQRLRRIAEQRHGTGFDIKAFHDTVLGSGSVSLPVLRELLAMP
jgi:uncharacterized protein (DUF885 family)